MWDERLKAVGTQEVCAVGDVARWHNPRHGERIRVEHWTDAADRAAAVTRTLTGADRLRRTPRSGRTGSTGGCRP
jgi:NADPH-dependent 2,4-dienoyl-CoA reductase/sulfur reductase-like enzyme